MKCFVFRKLIVRRYFLFLIFYVFFFTNILFPAFDFKITSPKTGAMGDANTGLSEDCNSVIINPSGMIYLKNISVELFTTKLYGLEELTYNQVTTILPVRKLGSFGFGYISFGDQNYKESEIIFAHALYLGKNISFGYKIKYLVLTINEYGSQSVFGIDAGVLVKILSNFNIGIISKNINSPSIGENYPENLPRVINAGIVLIPLKNIIFTLDAEKTVKYPVNLKTGIDYKIFSFFSIRTGFQSNPSRYSFGFGINISIFNLDYAFINHPVLNEEHLFSLSFYLGRKK